MTMVMRMGLFGQWLKLSPDIYVLENDLAKNGIISACGFVCLTTTLQVALVAQFWHIVNT